MATRLLATRGFTYYADGGEIQSCVINLTQVEATLDVLNEFRQNMPENDEVEWLLAKQIDVLLYDRLIEPLKEVFPAMTCRLVEVNEVDWINRLQEYKTALCMTRDAAYIEIRDYDTSEIVAEIDLSVGKIKEYIGDWRTITKDRHKPFWEARERWRNECIEDFRERYPDPEWEGRIGISDIGEVEIAGTFLLFPAGTVKPWAEFCEENGLDFGD